MQVSTATESPVAVSAAVWALVSVETLVGAQVAAVAECALTVRALVGSLTCATGG